MSNQINESDQTVNFVNINKIDQAANFDVNSDANFDTNFDVNFDQTDKINKIDESDQTENFDQSDDLYQINNLHQINEFLRQTSLSSSSFKDVYEADCQMQSSVSRISKFLSSDQEYQHDQQNNLQNQTQIILISVNQS